MKAKLPPEAMEVPAYSTGTPFSTLINCIFKGCCSPDTRPFTVANLQPEGFPPAKYKRENIII